MIDNIMKAIGSFLGQDADTGNIRSRILDNLGPSRTEQPTQQEPVVEEPVAIRQPLIPDAPNVTAPNILEEAGITQTKPKDYIQEKDTYETLPAFKRENVKPSTKVQASVKHEDAVDDAVTRIVNNRGGLTRNQGQTKNLYMNILKQSENSALKGLTTVNGEKKFMMFESPNEKKESGQSKFEIGYGLKVKNDWLSNDPDKWLKIHGVPVNVKKGLTMDQVDTILKERIDKDRAVTSSIFSKWNDMTEEEKIGWQDLTYNGGIGLLKADSQAKTAANKGYTMEGLFKLTHFTRAGSNRYRGLLKRRLNMYNHAALSVPGAPVISEYTWGPKGMRVKFKSKVFSNKFSKAFRDKVNSNDGWYDVPGKVSDSKEKKYSMNDEFQFNK